MANFKSTAAFLAVAAALAASGAANAQRRDNWNPSLYSVNQPIVQRTDFLVDLRTRGDNLPEEELRRLADWFDALRLGYGDRIFLDPGSSGGPGARADVARVASHYGILLTEGVPVTAGAVQPGAVRVVVSRSAASVPGCPNWADGEEPGNRITTASNFGCATNSNIAAMVADPNDLVLGQAGSGSGDAMTASKAVRVWRETPPTGANGLTQASSKGSK